VGAPYHPAMPMRHRAAGVLLPMLLAGVVAACGSAAPAPVHPDAPTPSPIASDAPTATPSPLLQLLTPVAGQPPVTGRPWFLAIGDSVTSGFSADPSRIGVNSSWALQLQGLLAGSGRHWTLYDTACPSERTDTYYTLCPGRSAIPFLADTSQHDAAMAAITAHRADLRAILVDLGSNDLLRSQRSSASIDASIAALRQALTRIVGELRSAAPGVPVILCNFYDPLANIEPSTLAQLDQVNTMVAQVAAAEGARLADFRDAVNTVRSGNDPHLCDSVDCAHGDLHPTIAGHARLARAALAALGAH
jgi:lysophospholipase L1-like esterase